MTDQVRINIKQHPASIHAILSTTSFSTSNLPIFRCNIWPVLSLCNVEYNIIPASGPVLWRPIQMLRKKLIFSIHFYLIFEFHLDPQPAEERQ